MPKNKQQDPSKLRNLIQEAYEQNELDSILSTRSRARSITVGTAFGGVCEVTLRSETNFLYAQIQPTEVVELIEQLAAGIGVEIAMRPKQNFASWRGWEEVIDQRIGWDKIAWKGAAVWQLNGNQIEEKAQKKLNSSKEIKALPASKEKEEIETDSSTTKKPTTRKTRKKVNE
jgi:hypothetical protein